MTGKRVTRRDYATGLVSLFIMGLVLLPVGGVIIVGLLTPFLVAGLLIAVVASLFRRGPR